MIEELAHGLDRLADVTTELGGGVAEDMDARGREAGQAEIAPEAVVEGGAGDAVGACARLPERLGGMHGGEVLADIAERSPYRRERGSGKFTAAAQTALAEVAVEGGGFVEGDIAGCEVDDLRSASAGEDESEDDGEVPSALDGVSGMTWRSCCIWGAERPLGAPGRGLGRSTGSQGLAFTTSMRMRNLKKEEIQERRAPTVTGEGSRPRKADAMGEGEDVLRRDLIGRLMEATEEVAEGAVVGVRGAVGAGAALLLGEEGVEGALPASVGAREDGG